MFENYVNVIFSDIYHITLRLFTRTPSENRFLPGMAFTVVAFVKLLCDLQETQTTS